MARLALILTFVFFGISGSLLAQEDYDDKGAETEIVKKKKDRNLRDKFVINFSPTLSLGNFIVIGVEPTLGYKITPRFVVGAGPSYNFLSAENGSGVRESYHIYGGRAFTRYLVIPQAYITAEFEQLAASQKVLYKGDVLNQQSNTLPASFFVGAGYTSNFGRGFSSNIEVVYDVLDSPYSGNVIPNVPIDLRFTFGYSF